MEIRLDRFLSENTTLSRSEIKNEIRRGKVTVDGIPVKSPEFKLSQEAARVFLSGKEVTAIGKRCFLMHKPAGYVTSTEDPRDPTVMELIPEEFRHFGLLPIGRLDKETEGLLLFTNDGDLLHRVTSPKYSVEKCYYAEHEGTVTGEDISSFARGLTLRDGTLCKGAKLSPIEPGKAYVTVTEGKYHQVRRMMASKGHTVTYLRRISEGKIRLGDLPVGRFRELTQEELQSLCADSNP